MTKPNRTTRPNTSKAALLLAGSVIAAAIAQPAMAQKAWDGSESNDFGDPANWTPAGVPGAGDQAVVDTTTNAPEVGAGDDFTVSNAIIGENATGALSVVNGGSLQVTGSGGLGVGGFQISGTNGNGTVLIDGTGSQLITGRMDLAPRSGSTGLITISNGGLFQSSNGFIGRGANSRGTLTVTGANSRWVIDSGAAGVVFGDANNGGIGTLNVLAGGTVTYPGGVGWTLNAGSSINVDGAGSSLATGTAITSRGAITVTNGGSASFSSIQGSLGASATVSGANSTLTVGTGPFLLAQGSNAADGFLSVTGGGSLTSTGFSFAVNGDQAAFQATVSGAGTRWTVNQGNAQNLGAGTNTVTLQVLDGAVIDTSASINNWSIGQRASILVSGAGSRIVSGGVFNLNATTVGEPVGSFIVENGGEVSITANGLSSLGSLNGPVSRSLVVRSGGQLNFTGGSGAGLSVRNGSILVDGGTLTGRLELSGEAVRRTTVTVQGGGLIDGTGGGGWSANSGVDFLVTGANSRLIAVGAPVVGGDVTVSAGGNATFQSIDLGSSTRANALTISGANSQFTSGDFFVARFNDFDADVLVENGARLVTGRVLVATNSNTSVVNLTVTGAGSLWQVASGATALDLGAGAADVNLSILNGGLFQSLSAINPSFRPNTDLLISGAGSTFDTAGNISFGGASLGQPVGTLVIENGGTLITRGPSDNGLGFNGVLRTMVIRNGGSWIMTGGANSGLQIETTDLLVDGGTLSAEGNVLIGQRFTGTTLTLINSDFAARQLDVRAGSGTIVNVGGTRTGAAGGVGAFNVGSFNLGNGNALVINHTETDFALGSAINGSGTITHLAGTTRFTGGQGGFSGLLEVTGGQVAIDGFMGISVARSTFDNARLSGSGAFGGDVTLANATFAPAIRRALS